MRKFIQRIWCRLGQHEWTCAAEQGIKPTPEQASGGVDGFLSYATMYCSAYRKVYTP